MNFFHQIATLGLGMDIVLRIKGKNGKLTIYVEPQLANASRLKPLVLTGTPQELDDGFIAQFDGLMSAAKGLESNLAEVKKDAEDLAKNPPKTDKSKPAPTAKAKPSNPAKPAPKKGKDKREKKVAKPAAKKEDKQAAQPGDMFSQPADETETPSDETNAPVEEPTTAGEETNNETE